LSGSNNRKDLVNLYLLRSLNDSAIRIYYTYEFLSKLLRSQEKSLLEEISVPAGIVASVISILAFIQTPGSRDLVMAAYGVAMAILVVAPLLERKLRKKNGLSDVTYLAIYLDEVTKYTREIKLAERYNESATEAKEFIDDTKDAIRCTLPYLRRKIKNLREAGRYPKCLEEIGRSEHWLQTLQSHVKSVVGESFLEEAHHEERK